MVYCRLVSRSAVGLGEKWNGRIVFGDIMQSERGLFTTKIWGGGGGYLIVFVSFEESVLRCLLR